MSSRTTCQTRCFRLSTRLGQREEEGAHRLLLERVHGEIYQHHLGRRHVLEAALVRDEPRLGR